MVFQVSNSSTGMVETGGSLLAQGQVSTSVLPGQPELHSEILLLNNNNNKQANKQKQSKRIFKGCYIGAHGQYQEQMSQSFSAPYKIKIPACLRLSSVESNVVLASFILFYYLPT